MQIDAKTEALMEKRMRSLVKAWGQLLCEADFIDGPAFALNSSIASKVIHHYARDLSFLKQRYSIPNRVQAPKVAGLMANAILKYRPLVPANGKQKGIGQSEVNEILAVYYGLCVCANYETDEKAGILALAALMLKPTFDEWFNRFVYLLRERNYTSESLIMVFETLCMAAFPNSLTEKTIRL